MRAAVNLVSAVLTRGGRIYTYGLTTRSNYPLWGIKHADYNPGQLTNHWSTIFKSRRQPQTLTGRRYHKFKTGSTRYYRRVTFDLKRLGFKGRVRHFLTTRLTRGTKLVSFNLKQHRLNYYRFDRPGQYRFFKTRRRYSHSFFNFNSKKASLTREYNRLPLTVFDFNTLRFHYLLRLPRFSRVSTQVDFQSNSINLRRFRLNQERKSSFLFNLDQHRQSRRLSKVTKFLRFALYSPIKRFNQLQEDRECDQVEPPRRSSFRPFIIRKYYPYYIKKRRWRGIASIIVGSLFKVRRARFNFSSPVNHRKLNTKYSRKKKRTRRAFYRRFRVFKHRPRFAFSLGFHPVEKFDRIRTQKKFLKRLYSEVVPPISTTVKGGYSVVGHPFFKYYRLSYLRKKRFKLYKARSYELNRLSSYGGPALSFNLASLIKVKKQRFIRFFPALAVAGGLTGQKTGFINEIQNSNLPAVVLHDLDFGPARAVYGVPWNNQPGSVRGWSSLINSLWLSARAVLILKTLSTRLKV